MAAIAFITVPSKTGLRAFLTGRVIFENRSHRFAPTYYTRAIPCSSGGGSKQKCCKTFQVVAPQNARVIRLLTDPM